MSKDEELTSLHHKLVVREAELRKSEEKLWEYKQLLEGQEASSTTNEVLTRKIRLLEEDLDAAGGQLIETMDRCDSPFLDRLSQPHVLYTGYVLRKWSAVTGRRATKIC